MGINRRGGGLVLRARGERRGVRVVVFCCARALRFHARPGRRECGSLDGCGLARFFFQDGEAFADFAGHAGIGEFLCDLLADAECLAPVLVMYMEGELHAQLLQAFPEYVACVFLVGFGFGGRQILVELFQQRHGGFEIVFGKCVFPAFEQFPLLIVARDVNAVSQTLRFEMIGKLAAETVGLARWLRTTGSVT